MRSRKGRRFGLVSGGYKLKKKSQQKPNLEEKQEKTTEKVLPILVANFNTALAFVEPIHVPTTDEEREQLLKESLKSHKQNMANLKKYMRGRK